MKKAVTYVMAPEESFYSGHVMRRVTADVGNGVQAVTSETTTGMELDEFQKANSNIPVDGVKGNTLASEVSYMTDEQLAALGLSRIEGSPATSRPKKEEEVLEDTYTFPVHEGYGWYRLSDGTKVKSKVKATQDQALLDADTQE